MLPLPPINVGVSNATLWLEAGGRSIDKHPNVAGQYLNAAVFFGTIFGGQSPIGAAMPLSTGSAAAEALGVAGLAGVPGVRSRVVA